MGKKDQRVDAYISSAPDFAQPILRHLRKIIHSACPEVEETIKWQFPHFTHRGILCHMAAFKHHCVFGFWHRAMREAFHSDKSQKAWGELRKITNHSDIPSDAELTRYIKKASDLLESGERRFLKGRAKPPLAIPAYFMKALKRDKKALVVFQALSPSHKREYVEWITEAKREETREKRLAKMLQMLVEKKTRNWKYEK
jgi:uncharacterized protein YdeI (YjbR/CyaY-like superfamily)